MEKWSRALDLPPDADELKAGIDRFKRFGSFNMIDGLAGGDPTKYEAVLMIDCRTVLVKLLFNREQKDYSKRYQKVILRKKQ